MYARCRLFKSASSTVVLLNWHADKESWIIWGHSVYRIWMPNIMHIPALATSNFVLLQENRLCPVRVKCKIVPLYLSWKHTEQWMKSSTHMEISVWFLVPIALSRGKSSWCSWNRMLVGLQNRSGRVEEEKNHFSGKWTTIPQLSDPCQAWICCVRFYHNCWSREVLENYGLKCEKHSSFSCVTGFLIFIGNFGICSSISSFLQYGCFPMFLYLLTLQIP